MDSKGKNENAIVCRYSLFSIADQSDMQVVADLHLHSKYSRAVSPQMILSTMAVTGKRKGLSVLATGDWTHPLWFREIRSTLSEAEEGLYKIKQSNNESKDIRFLLSTEISNIYTQGGKGRRIHNLVWCPSLEIAEKINAELIRKGCNLNSDGRPIIGISSKNLLELILTIDERNLLIPCHIFTPWFGLYGMKSGFNSIQECFGELSDYIYGIETGLSSDPEMNWQIQELNCRSILSFSDAHSPVKMGREATVFSLSELTYESIREAVIAPMYKQKGMTLKNSIAYTIEFYPEEGKYHYSGHRKCNTSMPPQLQRENNNLCPVCKRKVTDGVVRRVQELASEEPRSRMLRRQTGVQWFVDPKKIHPPFVKIVPLIEIIAQAVGVQVGSKRVEELFHNLITQLGSELDILLTLPLEKISEIGGKKITEGIQKVRDGTIVITPGFDGVYGTVSIWSQKADKKKEK